MTDLRDSRVVVTGAASGIGRAIAVALAAEGADLVLNDLDDAAVTRLAEDLGAVAAPGDAATEAGVGALIEAAGDVDIWFGNAGIERGRGLESTDADWAASLEVNVMAHVRAARLLVPRWIERGGGRMVITASAAGLLTMLGTPSYSVSKHGAVAFAEWLSATYRHRGVVVQCLCPMGVRTPLLDGAGPGRALLEMMPVLSTGQVASTVVDALADDRFLILPHPEVQGYYSHRAADTDRWLEGMNGLQQQVIDPAG